MGEIKIYSQTLETGLLYQNKFMWIYVPKYLVFSLSKFKSDTICFWLYQLVRKCLKCSLASRHAYTRHIMGCRTLSNTPRWHIYELLHLVCCMNHLRCSRDKIPKVGGQEIMQAMEKYKGFWNICSNELFFLLWNKNEWMNLAKHPWKGKASCF